MTTKKRNILLTGATGYIGRNLLKTLQKNRENVFVMTRDGSDQGVLEIDKSRIFVYKGKVSEIIQFFIEKEINIVFHLAAYQVSEHTAENLDLYLQANVILGVHLLEALKESKVGGQKCFISYGTNWQHYDQEIYRAVNLYAATKEAFGRIVDYYADAYDLKAITLELYDTYGEFDRRNKIINLFLQQAEDEILETTAGDQKIDLLYIDDVVAGSIQSLETAEKLPPATHKRYCLSTDTIYSIKEVAAIFEKIFSKNLKLAWGDRPYKKREMWFPYREGERLPGWAAQYSLEEGLTRMKERMS